MLPPRVEFQFSPLQSADQAQTRTEFTVFDRAGTAIGLQLATVLEAKGDSGTTFRWLVHLTDSSGSELNPVNAIASGAITFDPAGRIVAGHTAPVDVDGIAGGRLPLSFELDFSQLTARVMWYESGDNVNYAYDRQDGYQRGMLTDFSIGESGLITGVFDNGMTRTLGQIQLATFRNPRALAHVFGSGLYAATIRSGRPQFGTPGDGPLGELTTVTFSSTEPQPSTPWPLWLRRRYLSFLDRFDSTRLTVDHSNSSPQAKLLNLSDAMRWVEIV